jgi:hypothetical protein
VKKLALCFPYGMREIEAPAIISVEQLIEIRQRLWRSRR